MVQNKSILIALGLLITSGSFASEIPKKTNVDALQKQAIGSSSSAASSASAAVASQPLASATQSTENLQCSKCHKVFSESPRFQYHIRNSTTCKPFEQATEETEKRIKEIIEKSTRLPNNRFECSECKKILSNQSRWHIEKHVRSMHIITDKYKCDICNKNKFYPNAQALKEHKKTTIHLKKIQEHEGNGSAAAQESLKPAISDVQVGSKRKSNPAANDSVFSDNAQEEVTSDDEDNHPAKRIKSPAKAQNGSAAAQTAQSTSSGASNSENSKEPTEQIRATALKIALKASLAERLAALEKMKQELIETVLEASEDADNGTICCICDKHISGDYNDLKAHARTDHIQ